MGCFSCCYSVSKGDKFESYKGQEQFKVLFDQCSASSQPDSGRSKLNALQQFGSENDFEQKPAAAAEMFTLAEMIHATSNWSPSHKIGQGGFGLVYKGRLRDGRMVAIKRGRKDQFAHRLSSEFRTEVEMLSQVCFSESPIEKTHLQIVRSPEPWVCFALKVNRGLQIVNV